MRHELRVRNFERRSHRRRNTASRGNCSHHTLWILLDDNPASRGAECDDRLHAFAPVDVLQQKCREEKIWSSQKRRIFNIVYQDRGSEIISVQAFPQANQKVYVQIGAG